MGRWKKGQSGNPGGRPKSSPATIVRHLMAESGDVKIVAQQLKSAIMLGVWPVEIDEFTAKRKGLSGKDMVLDPVMRARLLMYCYPQPKEVESEEPKTASTIMELAKSAEEHLSKTGTDD